METQINTQIYKEYFDNLSLLEEDREELKSKRGFTDKTIDKYQFRSLIPEEQKNIISNLRQKYSNEELLKAGLTTKAGLVNYSLLQKNILIPYFDFQSGGELIFIRPHKLGLPQQVSRLYQTDKKTTDIILTESEFKAVAMYQLNFTAIGLQGIASWTKDKFPHLVECLEKFDKSKFNITILFDTEDKNCKAHPKYESSKNKPETKYQNEFYSYILCWKLVKEGFNCKIASLPASWLINGKIDIDMALSQGRTEQDFRKIISQEKSHSSFLSGLTGECKSIVQRNITKYFHSSFPLVEKNNRYYWIKKDKEEELLIPISNFTIKLLYSIEDSNNNRTRVIEFKDCYNKNSIPFQVSPSQLTSLTEFKNFCSSKGDYLFTGSQVQLDKIIEKLYISYSGSLIFKPEEIGKLKTGDYLFKDCVYWNYEKEFQPIKDNIARRGLTGYTLTQNRSELPCLSSKEELNIPEFLELLRKNLGFKSFLGIGWIVATLISDIIYESEKCFPILFLFGKRQSGKNVYGRILMSLLGFSTEGKSFQTSTPKGIIRSLAKLSNLPFWLNEYRNSCQESKKEFLLNVYGREGYVKAETSNDMRTVDQEIKGTLIVSGQETPSDNGVFSRCLVLQFSEKDREDEYFKDIQLIWNSLPSFTKQILENLDKIKEEYAIHSKTLKKSFMKITSDSRMTTNYSIVIGAFISLIKVFNYDLDVSFLKEFTLQHCKENKKTKDRETEVGEFWSLTEVALSKVAIENYYTIEGDKIYIWFSGLFSIFSEQYRKIHNSIPFKESVIKDYLKEEDYFLESSYLKKFDKEARRCIVIDEKLFKCKGYNFFI